jgi:FtsP/CotA-like multicopper oxidase with cupredoxin domain
MNRRGLLRAAAAAGVATAAGCSRPVDGPGTGTLVTSALPLPERFRAALALPPVARPVRVDATPDHYVVTQRVARAEIVPGHPTTIWGYDGIFPGPTFRARKGRTLSVTVHNRLPVPTSTHLHGGVIPADSDGFPTDLIVPAGYRPAPNVHHHGGGTHPGTIHEGSRTYTYPIIQRAGTLWYHDHRMDFTGPQVWRGLAGMFLVADEAEDALPLPRDDRELPLLLCDRSFAADGSFRYPAADDVPGATGQHMSGVFGDVIMVNGVPWPRHEVAAVRHRLRFVNGSNARRYRLTLGGGGPESDDGPAVTDRGALVQIGSDDGLLAAPVPHRDIVIAPGERYDVIVDFGQYPVGSSVVLRNTLGEGPAAEIMRFDVVRGGTDDTRIPATLARDVAALRRQDAVATRQFDFRTRGGRWTVNGEPYDPGASLAAPRLDTVELWRFTSDFHHPVHVHLGHFQVLSRTGRDPDASDSGWKDTVDVRPYEVVEVLVRFAGYRGRYMMHCHNLEHEDMAMMANFDVV